MVLYYPKKTAMQSILKFLLSQGIRNRAKESGEIQARKGYVIFKSKKSCCREQQKHRVSTLDEFQQNSSFPTGEEGRH